MTLFFALALERYFLLSAANLQNRVNFILFILLFYTDLGC